MSLPRGFVHALGGRTKRRAVLRNTTQVRVRRRDFFNIVRYGGRYYHLVREAIGGNEHDRRARAHGDGEALDACDVESRWMHLCPSCHGRWGKDEERWPAAAFGQRADGTWLIPAGFFAKNAPKGSVHLSNNEPNY